MSRLYLQEEKICRLCGYEMSEHIAEYLPGMGYIKACPDWGIDSE